jgi:hypothetical protein
MGRFRGVSHRFQHDNIRRRRLLFRSWHRGTQEIDLILGTFADARLTGFDRAQLDRSKRCSIVPTPICSTGSLAVTRHRKNTTTT